MVNPFNWKLSDLMRSCPVNVFDENKAGDKLFATFAAVAVLALGIGV